MHSNRLIISILILLFSATSLAEQAVKKSWFSIEYIIFEHNVSSTQQAEPWLGKPLNPAKDIVYPRSAKAQHRSILPLSSAQMHLHGVYNRLTKLTAYTPIRHAGWLQAVQRGAKVIKLSIPPHTMGKNHLEGTLSFHRERFLHLDIDLQLTQLNPHPNETSLPSENTTHSPQATLFKLKDSRRVSVDKINYFDHPRFGVIAIIKRITSP